MSDDPETIGDVELTLEHHDFIRAAGASTYLLEMIRFDERSIGIGRNSAKQEVQKYVFWGDLDGSPEDFDHKGGGFFSKLWRGELFEAWLHADMNNRALMMQVFGKDRIVANGAASGLSASYVGKMVSRQTA